MGPFMAFMLVPCAAAVAVGWIARHWSLAGAAFTGGVGAFLLLAPLDNFLSLFLLPVATGAAVAGLALIPLLTWRPSASVWSRMNAALAIVLASHLTYLTYAMTGR